MRLIKLGWVLEELKLMIVKLRFKSIRILVDYEAGYDARVRGAM